MSVFLWSAKCRMKHEITFAPYTEEDELLQRHVLLRELEESVASLVTIQEDTQSLVEQQEETLTYVAESLYDTEQHAEEAERQLDGASIQQTIRANRWATIGAVAVTALVWGADLLVPGVGGIATLMQGGVLGGVTGYLWGR